MKNWIETTWSLNEYVPADMEHSMQKKMFLFGNVWGGLASFGLGSKRFRFHCLAAFRVMLCHARLNW